MIGIIAQALHKRCCELVRAFGCYYRPESFRLDSSSSDRTYRKVEKSMVKTILSIRFDPLWDSLFFCCVVARAVT